MGGRIALNGRFHDALCMALDEFLIQLLKCDLAVVHAVNRPFFDAFRADFRYFGVCLAHGLEAADVALDCYDTSIRARFITEDHARGICATSLVYGALSIGAPAPLFLLLCYGFPAHGAEGERIRHFISAFGADHRKTPFSNGLPHAIMMEQARRIASFLILYRPGSGAVFCIIFGFRSNTPQKVRPG